MTWAIAGFELRYQLRQPLWWLTTAVFFGLALALPWAGMDGTGSSVYNSPLEIVEALIALSMLGLFLNTAFVARAILRDFDCATHELVFSRPVPRLAYLMGRFLGGFLVSWSAFMGGVVGLQLGLMMPWVDPEVLGPFMPSAYLWALVVVALPNLLFMAAVFFSLAGLTRSMFATYLGVVAFFAADKVRRFASPGSDDDYLAAVLDPFAIRTLWEATRYWTLTERNTLLPPLGGVVLHNRLFWLGVGLVFLTVALCCFRGRAARRRRRRPEAGPTAAIAFPRPVAGLTLPRRAGTFTFFTPLRQLLCRTRIEVSAVLGGVPFLLFVGLGLCQLIAGSRYVLKLGGMPSHPVTHLMVRSIGGFFTLTLVIVVAIYEEVLHDPAHGYRIHRLAAPLAPGDEIELHFDLTVENRGFGAGFSDTRIVRNGTYFHNRDYFPRLGYLETEELEDEDLRRRYGLPPAHRRPAVDDLFARRNMYQIPDADWIGFAATISTSADQIAIAPGTLEKEWTAGDRRYFHYRTEAPIKHSFCFLSADYRVVRDRFREVAIEIYFHEPHAYNLERMLAAVKKSLAYYTAHFGPYPHRQIRIAEIPGYDANAHAFPTTVATSERMGFVARVDAEGLDHPFYVTAHEIAHQWWGHQVVGAGVRGWRMLSETLAQYSALMVMEKEYGGDAMRRLLRHELGKYFAYRGGDKLEEVPLMLVDRQGYVSNHKGGVVMYALRHELGERPLNAALARYFAAVRHQPPPYTNTVEFLRFLRAAVPAEGRGLLVDLFETITLFDNRVVEAHFAKRADHRYLVRIRTRCRKLRADAHGVETEIPLDDWIEVGIFGHQRAGKAGETVLFLDQRHVTAPDMTFELVVDERPVRAGIDPYNRLIDRNADDNVRQVKKTSVEAMEPGAHP